MKQRISLMPESPRFRNPWIEEKGFVSLGHYDYDEIRDGVTTRHRYDLYALSYADGDHVSFGARYGNDGPEYISGAAFKPASTKQWRFYVSGATAVAAARFFANHHPHIWG